MSADDPGRRLLTSAIVTGRWSRPFLLTGPAGGVREGAAEAFAHAVLCTGGAARTGRACGSCGSCHRVARGLHADDHVLVPAKGRVSIGVDQVEALLQSLSLRPVEGHAAVARIPDAERLTPQAQNALLKTLEEPPPRAALLLLVAAPRSLLETVRSRCTAVRFPPITDEALEAHARAGGASSATATLHAVASAGHPGAVEEAAGAAVEDVVAPLARAFATGRGRDPLCDLGPVTSWVRAGGRTLEDHRARLRMLLRILLAAHQPGGGRGLPAELVGALRDLPAASRDGRLRALLDARERVERNVDPAGILEALAVEVAAADIQGW